MFARIAVCLALFGLLSGCADTADTFPLNDTARNLGPMHVTFVRTGMARGPVTITMADGEILKGEYRVAFGTANSSRSRVLTLLRQSSYQTAQYNSWLQVQKLSFIAVAEAPRWATEMVSARRTMVRCGQ